LVQVHQITALEQLRSEWIDLYARCPQATPFQHPDWVICYWNIFKPGGLAALALRRDGRLAGIAPFCIADRRLTFIGHGITDYSDLLIEEDLAADSCWALLEGAAALDWDACDLQELPPWSALLRGGPLPVCSVCPVAPLPARTKSALRVNLRSQRRKLEERGEVRFETETDSHAVFLESLFELHRARWESRGQHGVLADPQVRTFHRFVAESFAQARLLRFHALRFAGEIAAIQYCFARGSRAYCYLTGFAPHLADYGPGSLITGEAVRYAAENRECEFDFLRGREPYKYVWGAADRPTHRLQLTRSAFEEWLRQFTRSAALQSD
jgi:CelD/BcsL family acetyltransferase involved in cellulose biosynthesis